MKFWEEMFGDEVSEENRLVLWELPGKASWRCASIAEATGFVEKMAADHDLFFGSALQPSSGKGRGKAATARVLGGVHLDIDCGSKGPATPAEALAAVETWSQAVGIPSPSCCVGSGGGVHAWWLFREPWDLTPAGERDAAATFLQRFQAGARAWWEDQGWKLDSTHDMARVLRIPGTLNHKYSPARAVGLVGEPSWAKVNQSDLDAALGEVRSQRRTAAPVATQHPMTTPTTGGVLPVVPARFHELLKLWPQLELTWTYQRPEFVTIDGEPNQNQYDLSLASMLVTMGFTDEEIQACIAAQRASSGIKPEKAYRADYMGWTLARAREKQNVVQAASEAQDETIAVEAETKAVEWEEGREAKLAAISTRLGAPIEDIKKVIGETPTYLLTVEGHEVPIGDSTALLTSRACQKVVANACGIRIKPLKEELWEPVSAALLQLAEEAKIDLEEESHPTQKLGIIIADWIEREGTLRKPTDDGWHTVMRSGRPALTRSGLVAFSSDLLLTHVREKGWRIDSKGLGIHLRKLGGERKTVAIRLEESRSMKRRWHFEMNPEGPAYSHVPPYTGSKSKTTK